jgi:hypothetical protein
VVGDEGEGESSCFAVPQRGTKVCFIKTILEVRLYGTGHERDARRLQIIILNNEFLTL